jgi:anti-anti-sigma factor
MSNTLLASPARSDDRGGDVATDETSTSQVDVELDVCVVRVAGELDCSSAAHAMQLCLDVGRLVVDVDLRELTFMDCGGYRGLVAARAELERSGGSLTISGAVGQPARLLELLGAT